MKTMGKKLFELFVLLMILVTGSVVLADTFTATIKEKGTGVPVENATVLLIYDEDIEVAASYINNPVYDETDDIGIVHFSDIRTPRAIRVLAPGYEALLQSNSTQQNSMVVYISPIEVEGEGLSVTAERLNEKTSKIILSAQELSQAPGSQGDPIKALSTLPGLVSAGENTGAAYMRGSDIADNIIWVNRAPVGYLYHFGGFQSTIHPKLIEDINLFTGGFPVEYGDALGGVIDVKLRPPKTDRTHTYFDISTITSSFLVEGPVNDTDSFYVSGRRSYIDLILSPEDFNEITEDENEADPDQFTLVPHFYDLQGLYRHDLEEGYLDTYFFISGDSFEMELIGSAISDPQLAGQLQNEIEFQTTGINWQQRLNQSWNHVMVLSYYHFISKSRVGTDVNGDPFFADVEESTIFFQPEWRYKATKKYEISLGISASYTEAPVDVYSPAASNQQPGDDFTSSNKYRLNKTLYGSEVDTYIKYRKRWTQKLTSTLGINYSNVKVDGGYKEHEISPRANLEYQISNDTLLFGGWGIYKQTPAAEELIEVFGNPELEVNKSEHRILGVEHKFNELYSIKTEIYHKPMENLVIGISDVDPPDNFVNEGTGEAYGLDVFFKREPRNKKLGWISLSLAKSERTNELTNETRDFAGDQPFTLTAVWGEPFSGNWKRWSWSIKAQYHSGTPYTEIIDRHREDPSDPDSRWIAEYGEVNAARTPDFKKVDIRFTRNKLFNESKLSFYVDIQNMTFSKNIVGYDYGNEFEKIDNPTEITGLPFFPYFGIELEF